jgi:hypothetical protein
VGPECERERDRERERERCFFDLSSPSNDERKKKAGCKIAE